MLCKNAKKKLSEYFDGVLDSDMSIEITRHVKECANCRDELERLATLQKRLKAIETVPVPDYLYRLVQARLKKEAQLKWYQRFKDAAAFRWSRIRTTGIQFYWTKTLGTAVAAFCFWMIFSSINLFYQTANIPPVSVDHWTLEQSEQVRLALSKNLGRFPIEQYNRKNDLNSPAINDIYFDRFWKTVDKKEIEEINEHFSIIGLMDTSGTMNIEKILEYPQNYNLLDVLVNVFTSARGRPASMNGRSISYPMVFIFSGITVSTD